MDIEFHLKQNILDTATVKELCNMRDNADFNLLSSSEISKLIGDICTNWSALWKINKNIWYCNYEINIR